MTIRGSLCRASVFVAVVGLLPLLGDSKTDKEVPASQSIPSPVDRGKKPLPSSKKQVKKNSASQTPVQRKTSSEAGKPPDAPLVLQWEVSHPRNTDQISLIFREEGVEMVTNTSSYQDKKPVQLGRFYSPWTREFQNLKTQIHTSHQQQKERTSLFSVVAEQTGLRKNPRPHRAVLRINGEEWQEGDKNFASLSQVIFSLWTREWKCLECAVYKRQKNSIVRTLKRSSFLQEGEWVTPPGEKEKVHQSRKVFSKKSLNCLPVNSESDLECVDPQFGIFEL